MKMRILLILVLLGFSARAGEPYFFTRENTLYYYERHKVNGGKLVQTTTMEVGNIDTLGGVRKVNYAVTLRKANGKEILGGRAVQEVTILENGNVETDFGAAVKGMILNMFPRTKITTTGIPAVLPLNMKPGDVLPDSHCTVSVNGLKLHIDVTARRVLRRETITTPAGTFHCVVAREFKEENGPMHHRTLWTDTWYAPGIGYVRHDDLDKNMIPETSEVLVRVTKF